MNCSIKPCSPSCQPYPRPYRIPVGLDSAPGKNQLEMSLKPNMSRGSRELIPPVNVVDGPLITLIRGERTIDYVAICNEWAINHVATLAGDLEGGGGGGLWALGC
jgi:hypothetical protein